nr:hypothetical protein [uncultured Campylobacter sp.]
MRNPKIKEAIAAVTQKQKALRSIYVQFLIANSVAFVFAGVYALLIDPSFEVVGAYCCHSAVCTSGASNFYSRSFI